MTPKQVKLLDTATSIHPLTIISMISEKSRTAFGYTETNSGPIEHLTIVGIFGLKGSIHAPVCLIPHDRNCRGLPFAEMRGTSLVYALPGGGKITPDGKVVS